MNMLFFSSTKSRQLRRRGVKPFRHRRRTEAARAPAGIALAAGHRPQRGRLERAFRRAAFSGWARIIRRMIPRTRFPFDAAYVHKWEDLPSIEALLATARPARAHGPRPRHLLPAQLSLQPAHAPRLPSAARGALRLPVPRAAQDEPRRDAARCAGPAFSRKQRELALARRFHRSIVATRYMRDELLINGFAPERIEIHAPVPPPAEPLTRRIHRAQPARLRGPDHPGQGRGRDAARAGEGAVAVSRP